MLFGRSNGGTSPARPRFDGVSPFNERGDIPQFGEADSTQPGAKVRSASKPLVQSTKIPTEIVDASPVAVDLFQPIEPEAPSQTSLRNRYPRIV